MLAALVNPRGTYQTQSAQNLCPGALGSHRVRRVKPRGLWAQFRSAAPWECLLAVHGAEVQTELERREQWQPVRAARLLQPLPQCLLLWVRRQKPREGKGFSQATQ